jgi:hypothetical protein
VPVPVSESAGGEEVVSVSCQPENQKASTEELQHTTMLKAGRARLRPNRAAHVIRALRVSPLEWYVGEVVMKKLSVSVLSSQRDVSKASRLTLEFGHFPNPGWVESGLWPEGPGELR